MSLPVLIVAISGAYLGFAVLVGKTLAARNDGLGEGAGAALASSPSLSTQSNASPASVGTVSASEASTPKG